jgi:hypothetical protein
MVHAGSTSRGGRSAADLPSLTEARLDSFPGGQILEIENIEGIILVPATVSGTRDTSGLLVLDTGAGYLALDHRLAERLGLLDDLFVPGSVDFADRNLNRLRLGSLEIDQIAPVLVLDASVVQRVTDRPVFGLLGERALRGRSLLIDYRAKRLAMLPALPEPIATPRASVKAARSVEEESAVVERSRRGFAGLLSPRAQAIRFHLAGDGKMIVRARIARPATRGWSDSLRLILDTGATKCVFFEANLDRRAPEWKSWPSIAGLSAPTLLGNSEARVVRVPAIELPRLDRASSEGAPGTDALRAEIVTKRSESRSTEEESLDANSEDGISRGHSRQRGATIIRTGVDAAVIRSPLSEALDRVVGAPVDGLLGYSFLRRYRVGIDYARQIVWLDPLPEPWDDRPDEYSHVGIQLERNGTAAEIVAIAAGSPAAQSGMAVGDTIVTIDGTRADHADLEALTRRLEGPPGTPVRIVVQHTGRQISYRLTRRRLL